MKNDPPPSERTESEGGSVPPPLNTSLPFFAYGSLKPGEPAHHQVQQFLSQAPSPAMIDGRLWIRDGLPLLELDSPERRLIEGFLLSFSPELSEKAYATICAFEPRKHYSWREGVMLRDPRVAVNVLVGLKLERGRAVVLEASSWTLRDDPVFSYGLLEVERSISSEAGSGFDFPDWPRFFRLQMAYLLLWSAVERYAALLLGPGLEPSARVRSLGRHEVFQAAFRKADIRRRDQVCDSRDPADVYVLDPANPSKAALYYYQVRNNLSHRGKGAWADGEIVRNSLVELKRILDLILKRQVGE
jgi:hypothetical protein